MLLIFGAFTTMLIPVLSYYVPSAVDTSDALLLIWGASD